VILDASLMVKLDAALNTGSSVHLTVAEVVHLADTYQVLTNKALSLECEPKEAPVVDAQAPESRDAIFHRLWTKAVGTHDYDKAEWKRLEKLVHLACYPVTEGGG